MPELSFQPLAELVQRVCPQAGPLRYQPMVGGASTRRFFRVELGDRSAVGMFVPEGAKPEEIDKTGHRTRWPFLDVRDLLALRGIRVPSVLAEATDDGWLLLEDLGDDTIANYLLRAPQAKLDIYQLAVRDLARAQLALSALPEECIVRGRAFDRDLLRWEVDHFREWGLEARGIDLNPEERQIFDRAADSLADTIAGWPRGFVHRDYQSRNLMVVESGGHPALAWIDFQDALLGPGVYDMVALLSDSYQEFERSFVEERLDEYVAHLGLPKTSRAEVGRQFEWITVQRKLKDAGRFVYIDRKKGNASFLPFVEPTIDKALAALDRLPAEPSLAALAELLRRRLR